MEEFLKYGDLIRIGLDENACIYSKGFIDASVTIADIVNHDCFPAIFRIFPQTIHSIQTELVSTARASQAPYLKETISHLKESAEGEIKTNIQIYSNSLNQPVKFNSLLQLQHAASGKFLSLIPKENAEIERENLKVRLCDFFSDSSLIRIVPVYKFQTEGDALVRYEDSIYLEINISGVSRGCYLHASSLEFSMIREINFSLDSKTKWRVYQFASEHADEKLRCGDYIWLTHSELQTAIIKKGNLLMFSDSINDTNGIWKIEGENEKTGATLRTDNAYRIKHLSSGMYLTLKNEMKNGRSKEKITLSKKKDLYSLWKINHIYNKKKFIEKNDLCAIVNCETGSILDGAVSKEAPVLNIKSSETSFFKMFKCEESLIREAMLIVDSKDPLIDYIEYLKAIDFQDFKRLLKVCDNVKNCLENLKLYCDNKLIGMIRFHKQFGQMRTMRQKMLREQNFIELFTEILQGVNIERVFAKSQENDSFSIYYQKIMEISQRVYEILIIICEKNPESQACAYSFIEIYKHYVNYQKEATSFLLSILENNPTLLSSISKPPSSLIEHYTWLLRVNFLSRKPHLIGFLQSICVCSGSGIKLTQEKIHESLFGNSDTFSKAVISTISQGDTLSVLLPSNEGEQSILLDSCFVDGVLDSAREVQINYFTLMLELFADMCRDRNYVCKSSIKDWFPIQVLISYIWNETLSGEIRSSFVRLMLSMHVDSNPRYEEKYPERVKNLQGKIDPIAKYKVSFSLLGESVYNNKKKHTVIKKNRDSYAVNEVVLNEEEQLLFRLKENIIEYIDNQREHPVYDIFSYQIIILASHLVRFKLIDNAFSIPSDHTVVVNPYDKRFKYEELDTTKLLRALLELLFFGTKNNHLKRLESLKTEKVKKNKKKENPNEEINSKIFEHIEPSPMIASLKTLLYHMQSASKIEVKESGYETSCKIEICKVLDYWLNWRLDYLINNVIEWFNSGRDILNDKEYPSLIPELPTNLTGVHKSKFTQHLQPEVKDLTFFGDNFIPELFQLFTETQDYELRTLILSIILKSYSIRSALLKSIEKIEVTGVVGGNHHAESSPIILSDIGDGESRHSHNPAVDSWIEFRGNIIHCGKLKHFLKEEKNELVAVILKFGDILQSNNHLMLGILDYINNYTFHRPQTSILNKLLKFMAYFLSRCEKNSENSVDKLKEEMNNRGIVGIIMSLLCDTTTPLNTMIYLLKLSSVLLKNGNTSIQNSFYIYFSSNQSAQDFFSRLSTYFITYCYNLKEYFPSDIPLYKSKEFDCKVVLTYLQLLCENHNEKLQNYLREQFKSRRSFNLVTTLVFLLEELMKKAYDHHFMVISQCFDTLIEMIQGPCKASQISLIDSKFLELAGRLLSFDEKSDHMAKYKLLNDDMISSAGSRDEFSEHCLKGWMIAHLKYKCLIALLSCLEGQTGNYIITRMIRSLNIEILKENMTSFYYSYTEMYPKNYYDYDLFNHSELNYKYHPSRSAEQDENPGYFELIIEVGFLIFHLMCHFKDDDDPDNKRIVKNELPDLLLQEETENFFGTKLIKDLGKFGIDFLKTGFKEVHGLFTKKKLKAAASEMDKEKLLRKTYQFFQKNTGNVEIICKGEIFRIYFSLRPESHHLSEDLKINFHFYVDRSSSKTKIQYLLVKADDMIEEMEHEFKLSKLFNKYKIIALITSNVGVWKEVGFTMTLALNFLIISSYGTAGESSSPEFLYDSSNASITLSLIKIFGTIQLACSVCIVAYYLVKATPLLIVRGWRKQKAQAETRNIFKKIYRKMKNGVLTFIFALSTFDLLYQLGYLVCSVLGLAVHTLFFTLHLLDVLYRYPTLQNVIKAISSSRKSLLLSFLFILILIYLFSIWSFLSFYNDFYNTLSGSVYGLAANPCDNMLDCLRVCFDEGLKNGGGIGDYLNQLSNEAYTANAKYDRLVSDTLFYICIVLIMLNIIQGIIIDKFAILRGLNDANTEDQENKCFICSLDREFVEYSTNRPLRFHTTYEHNEWNYLHFINYLYKKDPNEFTGMESFLHEAIEKDDCSWIPQYRSLSIKQKDNGQENILLKKLDEIEKIYMIYDKEMKETKKYLIEYLESKHIIQ